MSVQTLPLPSARVTGVVAHLVGFDAAAFHPGDFDRYGIACPDSVRSSEPRRQAEFLHGRLAARAALNAIDHAGRQVDIGEYREPLWPAGVVGSISHTRTFAAAAVARADRCAGLGIDLQEPVSGDFEPALLRNVLDAAESARLREGRSIGAYRVALAAAFSAKESLFKALFPRVGRRFGFAAARVTGYEPGPCVLRLTLAEALGPDLPAGRSFEIPIVRCSPTLLLTCVLIDRAGAA